jgi:hypothetical protein
MLTEFADTAEHDDRYSEGNQAIFLERYVIHGWRWIEMSDEVEESS